MRSAGWKTPMLSELATEFSPGQWAARGRHHTWPLAMLCSCRAVLSGCSTLCDVRAGGQVWASVLAQPLLLYLLHCPVGCQVVLASWVGLKSCAALRRSGWCVLSVFLHLCHGKSDYGSLPIGELVGPDAVD